MGNDISSGDHVVRDLWPQDDGDFVNLTGEDGAKHLWLGSSCD